MKIDFRWNLFPLLFMLLQGCTNIAEKNTNTNKQETVAPEIQISEAIIAPEHKQHPDDFIPQGYKIFEETEGDLNKDGIADKILIIKGTGKDEFFKDEYRGELDRNRRGIIILFKKNEGYDLAAKNYDCFSSENEDGGVYFAPELSLTAEKGKLCIHYAHGRYGYWTYTFRYKNSDFELIGYDSSDNNGPEVNSETSINFLTKKKLIRRNTQEDDKDGEAVFEETWEDIKLDKPYKLSEIKDFDELEVTE